MPYLGGRWRRPWRGWTWPSSPPSARTRMREDKAACDIHGPFLNEATRATEAKCHAALGHMADMAEALANTTDS
jgi:hypothetical protein